MTNKTRQKDISKNIRFLPKHKAYSLGSNLHKNKSKLWL